MSQNIKKGFLLSFIGVFSITFDTLLLRLLSDNPSGQYFFTGI